MMHGIRPRYKDLKVIYLQYHIPPKSHSELAVLEGHMTNPPPSQLELREETFKDGRKLSFYLSLIQLFKHISLVPTLLVLNSWRLIIAFSLSVFSLRLNPLYLFFKLASH